MRKILTGLLISFLLIAGVVVPGGMVYAEEEGSGSRNALEITPSGARLTLAPGEVLEGKAEHCPRGDDGCSITVKNIGTGTTRFKVYTSPYVVSGEANELSFSEEASTTYTQLSRWITVQNAEGEFVKEAEFKAEPGQSTKIQYRINVPDDIPGGSQYAVIWAQIINEGESSGIETVGQIGAVLTGRSTENTVETAEISEYDFTKFTFDGPLTAQATVKNTGNTDFAIKYYYTAKTLFGKEIPSLTKSDFIAAYPDTTYHVNVEWTREGDEEGNGKLPFMGIFQVEWKVSAADQEVVHSAVVIVMPVVVIIVMILLLTVIIVWIIIIIRKSKERKARKLA